MKRNIMPIALVIMAIALVLSGVVLSKTTPAIADEGYPSPVLSECTYISKGGYPVTFPCYTYETPEPTNTPEATLESDRGGYPAPILSECSFISDGGYPVTFPCYTYETPEPTAVPTLSEPADRLPIESVDEIDKSIEPVNESDKSVESLDAYQLIEPTFEQEWKAEMQEIQDVIDNVQPFEESRTYKQWQELKRFIEDYFGKMILWMK